MLSSVCNTSLSKLLCQEISKSHNADATAVILRNALKQVFKEATSYNKMSVFSLLPVVGNYELYIYI